MSHYIMYLGTTNKTRSLVVSSQPRTWPTISPRLRFTRRLIDTYHLYQILRSSFCLNLHQNCSFRPQLRNTKKHLFCLVKKLARFDSYEITVKPVCYLVTLENKLSARKQQVTSRKGRRVLRRTSAVIMNGEKTVRKQRNHARSNELMEAMLPVPKNDRMMNISQERLRIMLLSLLIFC